MNINEKIALFQRLNSRELLRVELFYDVLEKCGALKTNYDTKLQSAEMMAKVIGNED